MKIYHNLKIVSTFLLLFASLNLILSVSGEGISKNTRGENPEDQKTKVILEKESLFLSEKSKVEINKERRSVNMSSQITIQSGSNQIPFKFIESFNSPKVPESRLIQTSGIRALSSHGYSIEKVWTIEQGEKSNSWKLEGWLILYKNIDYPEGLSYEIVIGIDGINKKSGKLFYQKKVQDILLKF